MAWDGNCQHSVRQAAQAAAATGACWRGARRQLPGSGGGSACCSRDEACCLPRPCQPLLEQEAFHRGVPLTDGFMPNPCRAPAPPPPAAMGTCCTRLKAVEPLPQHDTHRLPTVPVGSVISSSYPSGAAWTAGPPPVAGYPTSPGGAWGPPRYGYPPPALLGDAACLPAHSHVGTSATTNIPALHSSRFQLAACRLRHAALEYLLLLNSPPFYHLVPSDAASFNTPAGAYYQPGPAPYGSRYRPGMGPGGAASLGAGAGLQGGVVLADAMTPDVVQQTTIYDGRAGGGGDWAGGGGDLNSFNDFGGGDFGGCF